jgi:hypothetical protein
VKIKFILQGQVFVKPAKAVDCEGVLHMFVKFTTQIYAYQLCVWRLEEAYMQNVLNHSDKIVHASARISMQDIQDLENFFPSCTSSKSK